MRSALFDELSFWMPFTPRYLFAEPNPLFYEQAAWGASTRHERLRALTALAAYHLPFVDKPTIAPVIVASARAIMTRTLPRRDYLKACKKLSTGQNIQPDALLHAWMEYGYQRVDTVLETGQFSHRGGLLDIWPMAESHPVRLDFFGDEIETIRKFDPATQRTIEKVERVLITPAREFLYTDALASDPGITGYLSRDNETGEVQPTEFHIPILHPLPASLFDYLPNKALVVVDDMSLVESMMQEVEEQAVRYRNESIEEGTLAADFPLPYLSWSELVDSLGEKPVLEMGRGRDESSHHLLADEFAHIERFAGRLKPFEEYLAKLVDEGKQVVVVSRQRPRLKELWKQSHPDHENENPIFLESSPDGRVAGR